MIKGKKPGRKAKDQLLTENFNTEKKLTPQERRDLKDKQEIIAQAKKNARLAARKKKIGDDADFGELDSDFQMLEDMRAVYQKLGGRKKLLTFIKKNDKAYELMVKELMKLESSMKQAEITKNKGGAGQGNGNVFVILKGLEEENKVIAMAMAADGESQIDMKSMNGILNPASEPEPDDIPPDEDNIIDPSKG